MTLRTCLLIKPDGIEKKVVGKVIERLEQETFDLIAMKLVPPDRKIVEEFYLVHKGKPFYQSFIDFMTEGPFIAMTWQGEDIISRCRKIIGATNSKEAEPGTLRNLYGTDNRRNLLHSSDSEASARKEIGLLFRSDEIA